jgi:TolA-binding protein
MNAKLQEVGAPSVVVKKAEEHTWWFSDIPTPVPVEIALTKLASENNISTADAAGILRDAQRNGQSYSFILGYNEMAKLGAELTKIAQPPAAAPQAMPPQQQSPEATPQATPPQDPAMMGMAPQMPQVNPAELAIAEVTQQLTQQNEMQQQQTQAQVEQLSQQMQMQQEANDMVVAVLQGIQQRTQEISNASGGQIPAEAMEAPMAAGQLIAPIPGPDEMPPPMPHMDTEGAMNPETVADQINPEMVDMVEDFQGQDLFDAGAVGMLSSAPVLQEVVSSYVPNLEKSLDNLGRILLTLWLQEKDAKEQLGDEVFVSLEDKLRTVFKSMGDVILSVNQNAIIPQSDVEQQLDMVSGPQA